MGALILSPAGRAVPGHGLRDPDQCTTANARESTPGQPATPRRRRLDRLQRNSPPSGYLLSPPPLRPRHGPPHELWLRKPASAAYKFHGLWAWLRRGRTTLRQLCNVGIGLPGEGQGELRCFVRALERGGRIWSTMLRRTLDAEIQNDIDSAEMAENHRQLRTAASMTAAAACCFSSASGPTGKRPVSTASNLGLTATRMLAATGSLAEDATHLRDAVLGINGVGEAGYESSRPCQTARRAPQQRERSICWWWGSVTHIGIPTPTDKIRDATGGCLNTPAKVQA